MEQTREGDRLFDRLPEARRPEPASSVKGSLTRTGILPSQALRALSEDLADVELASGNERRFLHRFCPPLSSLKISTKRLSSPRWR